jgi:hypothetical protein
VPVAFAGGGGFAQTIRFSPSPSSHQLLFSNPNIVTKNAKTSKRKNAKSCSTTVLNFLRKLLNLFICAFSHQHKEVGALPYESAISNK